MSDFITIAEAVEAVQSLVPLMMQKGFSVPSAEIHLGDAQPVLWLRYNNDGAHIGSSGYYNVTRADTISECVVAARAKIMGIQDPEKAAISRFQNKIARAVDEGRQDGIPDEYTAPVSEVVHTIHEALLAAPEANQ